MSHLFNVRLVKCIKQILPAIKRISIDKNRAIAISNSRQSVLTSIRHIPPSDRTNSTKTVVFGYLLLGLMELDDTEIERQLVYTTKRGLLYLQNDDYNAFRETLHDALRMAYDLENYNGITYIYDVLANGAFINKDYENAKDLFNTVFDQLLDQGGQEDDLVALHISLKLSKIYEFLKDYKNAQDGYVYCVQQLEEKLKIEPENEELLGLFSLSLDSYARYLINQGKIKHACFYLTMAYKTSCKLNGKVFEMNVIFLNDLGTLSYIRGKLDRALLLFRKAKQIGKQIPDMDNFSMVYINLANIYLKQGMLRTAEKHCVKGLNYAIKHRYEEGIEEAEICLSEIKNIKQKNC